MIGLILLILNCQRSSLMSMCWPSTERSCSLILWDMQQSLVMDHTDRGSKPYRWGKLAGHIETFNDSSFLEVSLPSASVRDTEWNRAKRQEHNTVLLSSPVVMPSEWTWVQSGWPRAGFVFKWVNMRNISPRASCIETTFLTWLETFSVCSSCTDVFHHNSDTKCWLTVVSPRPRPHTD